jgi:hypothetical protein
MLEAALGAGQEQAAIVLLNTVKVLQKSGQKSEAS